MLFHKKSTSVIQSIIIFLCIIICTAYRLKVLELNGGGLVIQVLWISCWQKQKSHINCHSCCFGAPKKCFTEELKFFFTIPHTKWASSSSLRLCFDKNLEKPQQRLFCSCTHSLHSLLAYRSTMRKVWDSSPFPSTATTAERRIWQDAEDGKWIRDRDAAMGIHYVVGGMSKSGKKNCCHSWIANR